MLKFELRVLLEVVYSGFSQSCALSPQSTYPQAYSNSSVTSVGDLTLNVK